MTLDEPTTVCPFCSHFEGNVKAGIRGGVQRYRCKNCNRRFSPTPKHRGIAAEVRQQAVELHAAGLSGREIGRQLNLKPRSIVNWIHQANKQLAENSEVKRTETVVHDILPQARLEGSNVRPIWRATIHDVASLADVSATTVSNFLNQKGRMSESTREVIRSAITKLHFTPNSLVKAIRERKTNILGVSVFGLRSLNDYIHQSMVVDLLAGINRVAGDRGFNVLLYTACEDDVSETAGTHFLDGKIDGLIWVGASTHERRHMDAARAGLPVMSLLTRHQAEGIGFVDVDNVDAIQGVVKHLVEQGHRRIGYIGGTINQTFVDRLQGYRLGLLQVGLKWDRTLVSANKAITQSWILSGRTEEYEITIDRWLSMKDRPTAIILTTDVWATWVVDYLTRRGLRVPDDMAVTGFDNTAPVLDPSTTLTTVAQDFGKMGGLAALGLIDMIQGASYKDCRTLLPGKLIIRASTSKFTTTN